VRQSRVPALRTGSRGSQDTPEVTHFQLDEVSTTRDSGWVRKLCGADRDPRWGLAARRWFELVVAAAFHSR
jgi:hypothetical protein